jgi:tRNA-specific 2-thiouridylase
VGLSFYTLGQRKGIGLGGSKDSSGEPWFVADKDLDNNRLVVVQGHDHPRLLSSALQAEQMSWVAGCAPAAGTYRAKTRYRQADAKCQLHLSAQGFDLEFSQPQWATTPGQSAVIYDGEVCLGGGIIHRVFRSAYASV